MGLLGSLTPSLFRSGEILGIADDALRFALQASEDSHPSEYMGQLRGEDARKLGLDRDGTVITDVLIAPGTKSNPVSAELAHVFVGVGVFRGLQRKPEGVVGDAEYLARPE